MITVRPSDEVTQHRDDVVVYRLPYAAWNVDLENPDNRAATIASRVLHGKSLTFKALPYRHSEEAQEVQVSGGNRGSRVEIIRIVRTKTETRRRAFVVKVL